MQKLKYIGLLRKLTILKSSCQNIKNELHRNICISFFNVYLFLRERESMSGVEAEVWGNRGSEAGSALTAVSQMQGSNS